MNANEEQELTVEIEKSRSGTKIRVVGISASADKAQFDQAYKLADGLYRRVETLDLEIGSEKKIQQAKNQVSQLWVQEENKWKLSASVTDASRRIALSLLRRYPKCITQADVIGETNIAQKTVSNHLGGRVRTTREYFSKCDGGHRLSEDGLSWAITKVIPKAIGQEMPSKRKEE
jgi:hypothetical protein